MGVRYSQGPEMRGIKFGGGNCQLFLVCLVLGAGELSDILLMAVLRGNHRLTEAGKDLQDHQVQPLAHHHHLH